MYIALKEFSSAEDNLEEKVEQSELRYDTEKSMERAHELIKNIQALRLIELEISSKADEYNSHIEIILPTAIIESQLLMKQIIEPKMKEYYRIGKVFWDTLTDLNVQDNVKASILKEKVKTLINIYFNNRENINRIDTLKRE